MKTNIYDILNIIKEFEGIIGAVLGSIGTLIATDILKRKGKLNIYLMDFKGKYWEPIGTGTNPFNGVMDLADYSIENTSFYQDYENPSPSYNGLFWVIGDDAVIMQTNNALWIALSIAGGVILLALIFILAFVIARKRKKKKFDELANG